MNVDPSRLPFGRRPQVHICIRDSAYGPEDRLYAVTVCDDDGDTIVRLTADDIEEGTPCEIAGAEHRRWLLVDGETFGLLGYHRYVGNVLWDAGYMVAGATRRLVARLLELGWHVDEVIDVD